MKRLLLVLPLLFLACNSIKIDLSDGIKINKVEEPKEKTIIKEKWKEYRSRTTGKTFNELPSYKKPYKQGMLSEAFLENGLSTVKFVRFLAGLSENVFLSDELTTQAQYGAVLMASYGALSHTPGKPKDMDNEFYKIGYKSTTSSNIHQSIGKESSLSEAVISFCDDSDSSNIDRLGHRRWVLNPYFGQTGFGYAVIERSGQIESYITMQVFDQSNISDEEKEYVLWPNKGYFPSNYFSPSQAWSVSLNPKKYRLNLCNPKVKLTRISDNKEWTFSTSDKNKNGKYFNIEKTNYGLPYCIIFRPDNLLDFVFSKKYKVEIDGLVQIDGIKSKLEYTVEFFLLI